MNQREALISVDDFLRAFKDSNPFAKNRVTEVGDAEVDVPAIHGDSLARLKRRIERSLHQRVSTGVMLLGAAGLGKSHLLARLSQWAQTDSCALVIFLHNVVASPGHMARYLLRAAVSTLAGHRADAFCESALYGLINRAVQSQLRYKGKHVVPTTQVRLAALRQIGQQGGDDAAIVQGLCKFLEEAVAATSGDVRAERRATAAVEWLSGEVIEDEMAEQLLLPVDDEDGAVLSEVGIEGVFRVLARLAKSAGRVLTLCIDQVDNLDNDQVNALASFLHVLLDHTPNLVVVTSGVKQSMTAFRDRGVIQEAAWDRLAQHTVELTRVDPQQARELVETRVVRFMQPFRALPSIDAARRTEALFPLDSAWLSSRLASGLEFRPRDIISWAHSRWEEQQDLLDALGGQGWIQGWPDGRAAAKPSPPLEEVIDTMANRKLAERLQERRLRPETLPPDGDNLSTIVHGILTHCQNHARYTLLSVERPTRKATRPPIYDLRTRERRADGVEVSTGIVFVTSNNKVSVASALKNMLEDPSPPDHRVLVTDDERRPLPLGPRGKEYLTKLEGLGVLVFEHVRLSFEEYATLDALAGLIGSARVGDLEIEYPRAATRSVSEREAIDSLHRQAKFLSHRLLRHFLTEEAIPARQPTPRRLAMGTQQLRTTIQEQLAWRLGLTTRELTRLVIDTEPKFKDGFEDLHKQIRAEAGKMHEERLIFATAQDDAMFLQLLAAR